LYIFDDLFRDRALSTYCVGRDGYTKETNVNGRIIPFKDIRKEALTRNKSFLKINMITIIPN